MTQTSSKPHVNISCDLRFAHIDGHTEFDFVPNRNELCTTGVDCEVRFWSLDSSDQDSIKSSFTIDDSAYSIAASSDRVFVALANNCVKSYQIEDGEDETTVCRFTANTTHLSLHQNQELLAIGAADFNIKLANLVERTEKVFQGHSGPVLSVEIDPIKKYLTSSSCDGSVCLWSIESKTLHYQWPQVLSKSNDLENSRTLCRFAWEPKFGEMLAIPYENNGVQLFNRGQWDKSFKSLKHPELENYSIVSFSKDNQLIAVCSSQSVVIIWPIKKMLTDSSQSAPLAIMYNTSSPITALKFNPSSSFQLCSTDRSGSLRIMKILSKDSKMISKSNKITSDEIADDSFDLDDIDDDDISFLASNQKIDNEKRTKKFANIDDNDDDNDENFTSLISKSNPITETKKDNQLSNEIEDEDQFDISAIKSKYEPLIFGSDNNDDGLSLKKPLSNFSSTDELVIDGCRINGKDLLSLVRGPRYFPPLQQPPFQSSSTPVHFKHRFMVWNSVGIVVDSHTETESSIDVEFHDITFHHSIHLTNMFNYTMADLSIACLLLASNGDDEESNDDQASVPRLFCQTFQSWDVIKEWQVCLTSTINQNSIEQFDCIAAGHTFVATITSFRFVRIWTVGGIQTSIFSIEGPGLNLSAYENFMMILYHSSAHHSDQGMSVSCRVLKIDHKGKTRCHPIPASCPVALSPKSTVSWAGFTDEGTPCVVDSDGIIRLYKNHFGNSWVPVCSTKATAPNRSDNYFVIGLSEIQAQVRCIYCKASRYPDTVPKPSLTIVPIRIPLCDFNTTKKGQHEEELLRGRWLVSLLRRLALDNFSVDESLDEAEKSIINSLIKLFALALGAERESLALEVAKLLPNSQALQGAIQYAQRQQHRSLAMKLVEMINEDDDQDENEDEQNSDAELEQLMSRKQADRLRQLLKEEENDDGKLISLMKDGSTTEFSEQISYTSLKPKNLHKDKTLTSLDVIEENVGEDFDDNDYNIDDNQLKPKTLNINHTTGSNCKNPFKIQNENPRKRKHSLVTEIEEEIEDDEDDLLNQESRKSDLKDNLESSNDPGFICFFEANRLELFETNPEVENEQDLIQMCLKQYQKLSERDKQKWFRKSLKISKKRPKKEENLNKITNFFRKN